MLHVFNCSTCSAASCFPEQKVSFWGFCFCFFDPQHQTEGDVRPVFNEFIPEPLSNFSTWIRERGSHSRWLVHTFFTLMQCLQELWESKPQREAELDWNHFPPILIFWVVARHLAEPSVSFPALPVYTFWSFKELRKDTSKRHLVRFVWARKTVCIHSCFFSYFRVCVCYCLYVLIKRRKCWVTFIRDIVYILFVFKEK